MSDGTQNGTAESDSRIFFPKKRLLPQKKAAGSPIKSATKVEPAAWRKVNQVTWNKFEISKSASLTAK